MNVERETFVLHVTKRVLGSNLENQSVTMEEEVLFLLSCDYF